MGNGKARCICGQGYTLNDDLFTCKSKYMYTIIIIITIYKIYIAPYIIWKKIALRHFTNNIKCKTVLHVNIHIWRDTPSDIHIWTSAFPVVLFGIFVMPDLLRSWPLSILHFYNTVFDLITRFCLFILA